MLIKQRPHKQVMPASTFTLIAAADVKALFICERRLVDTQIVTPATILQANDRDAHREGAHSWALINKTQEIIVEIDKELRGWKAHCVYLQDKCERLELENSRLKDVIDAANAQEPSHFAREGGGAVSAEILEAATDEQKELYCIPLYASPIPVQQSIEQAHMAGQADAGVDPSYSNAHSYALSAQQSQAVAVPAKTETIAKELSHASVYLYSYVEQLECILSTSSPRITEQDAQQIALSFYWFVENFKSQNGRNPSVVDWYDVVGCMMINKLNEGKNHGN